MTVGFIIYSVQHKLGYQPRWERRLIEGDVQLKTYKNWMGRKETCSRICHDLYHNRLNYLMGWEKR